MGVGVLVNLLVTDSCSKRLVFPLLTTPTHTPTGESWGHVCTIRLVLYFSGGERWAWLLKSPNRKEQTVSYQITVSCSPAVTQVRSVAFLKERLHLVA